MSLYTLKYLKTVHLADHVLNLALEVKDESVNHNLLQ